MPLSSSAQRRAAHVLNALCPSVAHVAHALAASTAAPPSSAPSAPNAPSPAVVGRHVVDLVEQLQVAFPLPDAECAAKARGVLDAMLQTTDAYPDQLRRYFRFLARQVNEALELKAFFRERYLYGMVASWVVELGPLIQRTVRLRLKPKVQIEILD